jgi:hypothetical protein
MAGRYPAAVFLGLDGARRYAFAKWYDSEDARAELQRLNDALEDRIGTLVPVTLSLVDSVLHDRNIEAFHKAWQVQTVIDEYVEGSRHSA